MTAENQPKRRKRAVGNSVNIKFFEDNWISFLANAGALLLFALIFAYLFFYVYLPVTTNHDNTISVPNLEGMSLQETEKKLQSMELRYEILDTAYSPNHKPLVVLRQNPRFNSQVKVNRKIYLTINASNPPKITMPQVIDLSSRSAVQLIESSKLRVGQMIYVPDKAKHAVLRIKINGKEYLREEIKAGITLAQGTFVDLILGDGLGDNDFDMPNLIGRDYDEAELYLKGIGLNIGRLINKQFPDKEAGTVVAQSPGAGEKVKPGTAVELTVALGEDDE
jgi:beta-lactam-binding protein with PASTA domain